MTDVNKFYIKADLGGHYYHLGPAPEGVDAADLTRMDFNDSQFGGGYGGLGVAYGKGNFLGSLIVDYVLNNPNNIDYYDAPQTSSVPGGGDIDLSLYPDKSRLRGLGLSLAPEWFVSEKTRLGVVASVLFPDVESNTPLKDQSGSQYVNLLAGVGPILEHDIVSGRLGALALVLDGQVGGLWDAQNQFNGPVWKIGAGLTGRIGVLGGTKIWVDGDDDGYGKTGSDPKITYGVVPSGWVTNDDDCNDNNNRVHPGAKEIPDDGLDNDCYEGDLKTEPVIQAIVPVTEIVTVPAEVPGIFYPDVDQDRYGDQNRPEAVTPTVAKERGLIALGGDCNDHNPFVHPGMSEITGNSVDDDCNATTPDGLIVINTKQEVISRLVDISKQINFRVGSYILETSTYARLDDAAQILKSNPQITLIRIKGYTSSEGGVQDNLDLSRNRANAVWEYLERQGVAGGRMKAEGYGETEFIGDDKNGTDPLYSTLNRRVVFDITWVD